MPRTRANRSWQPPPEPVIEVMENENSEEDMDVSDEDAAVEDFGAFSEPGRDDNESNSEEEPEDEIDVEDEEQEISEELEELEPEDELSSSQSQTPPPRPAKTKPSPAKPKLRIKLKLSGIAPTNTTPTPSDEMPIKPGRKGHPRHVDVESEDDEDVTSTRSTSYAGPTRLTHRQAALAGMVDTTEHLELEETVSKKKKYLNETELALKREETARKRKNLSVKKLEDEKTETINRLLKKQTRARSRKAAPTDPDEDADAFVEDALTSTTPPPMPTLLHWVSSSRPDMLFLSLSVPPNLLPMANLQAQSFITNPPAIKPLPVCDFIGCTLPRKYKLVKDPTRGGCGMAHLKALEVG